MEAGAGVLTPFCASGGAGGSCAALEVLLTHCYETQQLDGETVAAVKMAKCVLMLDAVSSSGEVVTHNQVALAPPKMTVLPNATVTAKVTAVDDAATITLEASGGSALYATLTTTLSGRFSDNALTVVPGETTVVTFVPIGPLADKPAAELAAELGGSLRVEHLAQHCC